MGSLRTRLIVSHVGLAVVLIVVLGVLLVFVLESQVILVNLSTQLNRQAALLVEMAKDYPQIWAEQAAAEAFVKRFDRPLTSQLMLLDAGGRVLASSDANDRQLLGQTLAHPELARVQAGQISSRTDYSQDLQAEIADIMIPAFDEGGEVQGMVRLTHQLSTTQERFQRLRLFIGRILALGLLLGVALAFLLAWQLEKPIERLTRALYRLASGEEPTAMPVQGPTELRLLAKGFNNLVERLRILRVARRQLIANLVHEMGRPLGALRLANQALLEGADEEPALRRQLLQGTEAELKTLQLLLDDLVAYYEQAGDEQLLDIQSTDLGDWLSTLAAPWAQAAQAKELRWQTHIPPDLPRVAIDPERLGQALGNLIENAIKYTPPGGEVTLTAGLQDDEAWIRISDTGRGIPPSDQAHVFKPFYRSRGSARMPEGMGLGLTISKNLVEAHGGRLVFTSQPGSGTQFTIFLTTG